MGTTGVSEPRNPHDGAWLGWKRVPEDRNREIETEACVLGDLIYFPRYELSDSFSASFFIFYSLPSLSFFFFFNTSSFFKIRTRSSLPALYPISYQRFTNKRIHTPKTVKTRQDKDLVSQCRVYFMYSFPSLLLSPSIFLSISLSLFLSFFYTQHTYTHNMHA